MLHKTSEVKVYNRNNITKPNFHLGVSEDLKIDNDICDKVF